MQRKVRLKYEMGKHSAGEILPVHGEGASAWIDLVRSDGCNRCLFLHEFPQLFEEVTPVLKEVRLVSIGKSVKGAPVPASAEGVYLKGDPGSGFVPVSPERYGLVWNWERDLFRAEEIYE